MANVGQTELLLIALIVGGILVGCVPGLWVLFDAARTPDDAWRAAGADRATWIVGATASMLLCTPAGALVAAIYALRVRPALKKHGRDARGAARAPD